VDGRKFTLSSRDCWTTDYDVQALQASFDECSEKCGVKFHTKFLPAMVASTCVDDFVHPSITAAQLQAIHEWRSQNGVLAMFILDYY
jgi:hypothetical protein